jgi:hypothetical protein
VIVVSTQEIIKELMKKDGKTNSRFASDLKISQAALWDRLNNSNRKDFSVNVLSEMVRLLGYKIQIVPISNQKPKDGYEL